MGKEGKHRDNSGKRSAKRSKRFKQSAEDVESSEKIFTASKRHCTHTHAHTHTCRFAPCFFISVISVQESCWCSRSSRRLRLSAPFSAAIIAHTQKTELVKVGSGKRGKLRLAWLQTIQHLHCLFPLSRKDGTNTHISQPHASASKPLCFFLS